MYVDERRNERRGKKSDKMEYGGVFGMRAASSATASATASPRLAASLEIIRMDDYLVTGTRKQFWQEEFVAAVIKVKELLGLFMENTI